MAESTHTPLPWSAYESIGEIVGANYRTVCFFRDYASPEDLAAHADLIVKAVNNHKRLVVALSALVKSLDGLIKESYGVNGLHLNGDVARWHELMAGGQYEEWLEDLEPARALLVELTQ